MDDRNQYREPVEYRERMDRLRVLAIMQGVGRAYYVPLFGEYPWTFSGGWGQDENAHLTRTFRTFEELETYVLEMDIGDPA